MSRWVMRHAVRHESRRRGLGAGMVSGEGRVLRILLAPVVAAPGMESGARGRPSWRHERTPDVIAPDPPRRSPFGRFRSPRI